MPQPADIGLIGLAVMGRNLVLNLADHGYTVAVFNRSPERTDDFVATEAAESAVIATHSLDELVGSLECPRVVMLMIKAGAPVDDQIEQLIPLLDAGDITGADIARIALPQRVPYGFHGNWVPDSSVPPPT